MLPNFVQNFTYSAVYRLQTSTTAPASFILIKITDQKKKKNEEDKKNKVRIIKAQYCELGINY